MKNTEKIHFNQYRDIGQIFNSTFSFIRQNFSVLFKTITLVSLPIIILAASIIILGIYTIFKNLESVSAILFSVFYFIIAGLILIAGLVLFIGSIFEFLVLYKEADDYTKITTRDIWKRVRKNFWSWLGKIIIWSVISGTLSSVFSSIFFLLMIPGVALGIAINNPIVMVLSTILSYAVIFICSAYVQSIGIPIFYLSSYDKKELFPAIGKAFQLMHSKGNFWKGIFATLIGNAVQYILTYSFMVPVSILLGVLAFNYYGTDIEQISSTNNFYIFFTIIFALYYIAILYSTVIYFISQSFKTGDLNERTFGTNILERIKQMGTKRDLDEEFHKASY